MTSTQILHTAENHIRSLPVETKERTLSMVFGTRSNNYIVHIGNFLQKLFHSFLTLSTIQKFLEDKFYTDEINRAFLATPTDE